MACCLYFCQCSRTWLALLVPIFAVFARLSSGHGAVFIPITFIFLSAILLLTFSNRKPSMPANSLLKLAAPLAENGLSVSVSVSPQEKHQENTNISCADCSCDDSTAEADTRKDDEQKLLMGSQDLYSESESMDQFSSTSSEDHSSDIEQRLDCSDGSISDEESLIEIEIPSGHFVSQEKDLRWNVKCCKLSQDFCHQEFHKDFWAEIIEFNEEDNLIEIDINMGSIKC